jgi:hypothetical protein
MSMSAYQLPAVEDLHAARIHAHCDHLADKLVRHPRVRALDVDLIVEVRGGPFVRISFGGFLVKFLPL